MTTIAVDEQTRSKLELNAAARGLALPEYLKLVADTDPVPAPSAEQARQEELRQRFKELIESADLIEPEPVQLRGLGGEFAEAMAKKHQR